MESKPMKLNRDWHLKHKMPEKPTLEQRISWHVEHARHCGCREIPLNLQEIIKKRGIKIFGNEQGV